MRAASFSVSFVDRPRSRGQQLTPGVGVDRLGRADRLRLTGRDLPGLQRLERVRRGLDGLGGLQQPHRVTQPHSGHVIEPMGGGAVTAPLPQIGLGHPTSRQRHPRRRQMLQPGELGDQLQTRHEHPSDQGRNHRPTTRRNRRRTRPPGPASRTSIAPWIAPSNPYDEPYSGGVTVGPRWPATSGTRPLATVRPAAGRGWTMSDATTVTTPGRRASAAGWGGGSWCPGSCSSRWPVPWASSRGRCDSRPTARACSATRSSGALALALTPPRPSRSVSWACSGSG